MNKSEIEAALQAAFSQCDAASSPLSEQQKQILLQVVERLAREQLDSSGNYKSESGANNPLDELTPQERQAFLEFIKEQIRQDRPWKVKLLNDWLQGLDSGPVQFIRELYGPQWLNRIRPVHLAEYAGEEIVPLKVGDRIEVSNSLWEWVQESGPCSQEWFPCTVVGITESPETTTEAFNPDYSNHTNCSIRFDNGMEYEIQGIYEWNRYNWRWKDEE